jgi:NADPH2:quinone reductase
MRTFMQAEPELFHRDRDELMSLFEQGKVHPHVSAVFALDEVREALRAVAQRRTTGKVVIEIR